MNFNNITDMQLEVFSFAHEMNDNHTDIVGMNCIITSEKRWDNYPLIRAENTFAMNGSHMGISKQAYAMVKELTSNSARQPKDILLDSKSVSDKRIKEIFEANLNHVDFEL